MPGETRSAVGGHSLERLAMATLCVAMHKDPLVRLSNLHYAALDVAVPLRIHACLFAEPDQTHRLTGAEATLDRRPCAAPRQPRDHGDAGGRVGVIVGTGQELPSGLTSSLRRPPTAALLWRVRIGVVDALGFGVLGLRRGKAVVALVDIGPAPFVLLENNTPRIELR